MFQIVESFFSEFPPRNLAQLCGFESGTATNSPGIRWRRVQLGELRVLGLWDTIVLFARGMAGIVKMSHLCKTEGRGAWDKVLLSVGRIEIAMSHHQEWLTGD